MRIRSGTIKESLNSLQRLEGKHRHRRQEHRVKVLRLLKEYPSWTLQHVASLVGRSPRTVYRWWHCYQRQGLKGLLDIGKAGGERPSRLNPSQIEQLQKQLKGEGFVDMKQAQRYLADEFEVDYSLSGVKYLIRIRLKAKLKTGRPKAKGQNPAALAEFKKKVGAARPVGSPGMDTR